MIEESHLNHRTVNNILQSGSLDLVDLPVSQNYVKLYMAVCSSSALLHNSTHSHVPTLRPGLHLPAGAVKLKGL